ncbi:hypothetical protein SVEN_6173 [Streptomyces venezuelae ATCC 10712]|uniref:Uncharacterized protein n=1 Tax=Streptomyces venezuelae (strain ATCC 10712 / CBS 650.69 / DSM 40230 / JCM 4526 / NBRC 13096 / PD 04745) TaxID=953739 RepID=F2RDG7_STRVP|nr:hypothetical protein SVEN_6173 [Streptomyces venezuelae ATCC 10712]
MPRCSARERRHAHRPGRDRHVRGRLREHPRLPPHPPRPRRTPPAPLRTACALVEADRARPGTAEHLAALPGITVLDLDPPAGLAVARETTWAQAHTQHAAQPVEPNTVNRA